MSGAWQFGDYAADRLGIIWRYVRGAWGPELRWQTIGSRMSRTTERLEFEWGPLRPATVTFTWVQGPPEAR